MKYVTLLLLIANMVFFAWQYPQQGLADREQSTAKSGSSVLASKVATAPSLMMLKELPAAVAEKITTANTGPPSVVEPLPVALATPSSRLLVAPAGAECWRLGPFANSRQADRGLTILTAEGVKARAKERKGSVLAGYRVQLPAEQSKASAQRTMRELRGRGVSDIAMLADKGRYFVALGFFSKKASARKREAALRKLGYKPSTDKVYRESSAYWLELYKVTELARLDKAWVTLSRTYPKIERSNVACSKDNR